MFPCVSFKDVSVSVAAPSELTVFIVAVNLLSLTRTISDTIEFKEEQRGAIGINILSPSSV